jgi:hypothetical protein
MKKSIYFLGTLVALGLLGMILATFRCNQPDPECLQAEDCVSPDHEACPGLWTCVDSTCVWDCDENACLGKECGPDGYGGLCPPGCASGEECQAGECVCEPNACGGCGPVPLEICDGIDNDCNGQIDEGKPTAEELAIAIPALPNFHVYFCQEYIDEYCEFGIFVRKDSDSLYVQRWVGGSNMEFWYDLQLANQSLVVHEGSPADYNQATIAKCSSATIGSEDELVTYAEMLDKMERYVSEILLDAIIIDGPETDPNNVNEFITKEEASRLDLILCYLVSAECPAL